VRTETKRNIKISLYVLGGVLVFFGLMNVWKYALRDWPLDSATVGLMVAGCACVWIASELK
jgi:hypothetical protein